LAARDLDGGWGAAVAGALAVVSGCAAVAALHHLAHEDFRVLLGWDPENLANFLTFCADCESEF
jgi:hypothetical protein